jgi:hypothetical protein
LGPLSQILGAKLKSTFLSPRVLTTFAQTQTEDLLFIKQACRGRQAATGYGPEATRSLKRPMHFGTSRRVTPTAKWSLR